MQTALKAARNGKTVFSEIRDIKDAESFSRACLDIWNAIEAKAIREAPSIGALQERLEGNGGALDGLTIVFAKSS